jgi:hypothetical protein
MTNTGEQVRDWWCGGENQEEIVTGVHKCSIREATQKTGKFRILQYWRFTEHSSKNCVLQCIYTGMRRVTTFRSTTDRIYDGGPIK